MNPTPEQILKNTLSLTQDLHWCETLIQTRINHHFNPEETPRSPRKQPPPQHDPNHSPYAQYLSEHAQTDTARLAIILALLPIIHPTTLDIFRTPNEATQRPYTEFGCVEKNGCLYPTGETLAFILGGEDLTQRLQIQQYLEHCLSDPQQHPLALTPDSDSPLIRTPLRIRDDYLQHFTTGTAYRPEHSADFPAKHVTTDLCWDDLVLASAVRDQLQEIQGWIKHHHTLSQHWGLKTRPGYRALFHGPPGTGKTITASLLGQTAGRDVYKIDLALVLSKYIGETEKNLEQVFQLAENKHWILFFDEADALFSKRSQASSANDQFANQNASYLLQRIEGFNGIIILAANFQENFDSAFFRRFESTIYFPQPETAERLILWQKGFSKRSRLAHDIQLEDIARQHSLSGTEIMNVIRYASLQAICRGSEEIQLKDLTEGIQRQQNTHRLDSTSSDEW